MCPATGSCWQLKVPFLFQIGRRRTNKTHPFPKMAPATHSPIAHTRSRATAAPGVHPEPQHLHRDRDVPGDTPGDAEGSKHVSQQPWAVGRRHNALTLLPPRGQPKSLLWCAAAKKNPKSPFYSLLPQVIRTEVTWLQAGAGAPARGRARVPRGWEVMAPVLL